MRQLRASHTHLYPGARGTCDGPLCDGPVLLEFSDGVAVSGQIAGDRLQLAAHVTAAGTAIPAKAWQIEPRGADGFRIRARAG
ncbi:hypothetical protein E0K89_009550 [Aquicoccus sp. SCR17]|nr:hypothetical protein [Carideicomes alvinocaridis]